MAGTADSSSRAANMRRPPKRSASIPAGILPSAPSKTGTAIIRLLAFAERPYACANVGARAPIKPQSANETAKADVERNSARAAPGLKDFIAAGECNDRTVSFAKEFAAEATEGCEKSQTVTRNSAHRAWTGQHRER